MLESISPQLGDLLKSFCLERIIETEDFAEAESRILDNLFSELSLAFSQALETFDDILATERDESWDIKDKRSRTVLTEFGEVTFTRRSYVDENGERRNYLDEVVDLSPRRRVSPGASEALVGFAGEVSYARAAQTVFRHCNSTVSATTTLSVLRDHEPKENTVKRNWLKSLSKGRKSLTGALVAAVLTLSLVGAVIGTVHGFSSRQQNLAAYNAIDAYPTNERGQTYGTAADATPDGKMPDLIAAVATNGESGYITYEDYVTSSGAATTREGAELTMAGYQQGAAEAFTEYILLETGVEISEEAKEEIIEIIYRTYGVEPYWSSMTEQQRNGVVSLLPEGFRSVELAQRAYEAAIAANDASIPVYAVDGQTIIGEFIVK